MFVCLQFYFHHSYEHENDYHDLSCHFADYFASQDLDQIYVNISSKPLYTMICALLLGWFAFY